MGRFPGPRDRSARNRALGERDRPRAPAPAILVAAAFVITTADVAACGGSPPPPPARPAETGVSGTAFASAPTASSGGTPGLATPSPGRAARPSPSRALGWYRFADAPAALTEVAAATYGGRIWIAGGFDEAGRAVRSVLVFDPATGRWATGPGLPQPLQHAVLAASDTTLWVIGGYVGSDFGRPSASVWRLDPTGRAWLKAPPLPSPRAAGAGAWDGQRLVYGGGVGPSGESADVFALEGAGWVRIGALSTAREHLGAASDSAGRGWFLGGRTGGLDTNVAAVDLAAGTNVRRIGRLPTARGGGAAFWSPGSGACLAGGEAVTGTIAAVECVEAGGAVRRLPGLGIPRHGLGAVVLGDRVYALFGGLVPGIHASNVVEALTLGAA